MPSLLRLLLFLGGAGATAFAAEVKLQSGPTRVALVELYTSEGCSSCPPAEQWLGELRQDAGLWTRFVPVAFHVNYWDHLGWRDVLATKIFTERQYTYAEQWTAGSVYTPCVVRNGTEFDWRGGLRVDSSATSAGNLSVVWQDDGTCRVNFSPARNPKGNSLRGT